MLLPHQQLLHLIHQLLLLLLHPAAPHLPAQAALLPGSVVKCALTDKRKRTKYYLAVVIETDSTTVNVKFLRQDSPTVFFYPQVDDVSWEPIEHVSLLNPQPTLDHRQRLVFSPEWDLSSA
jgi:hypothetical protein